MQKIPATTATPTKAYAKPAMVASVRQRRDVPPAVTNAAKDAKAYTQNNEFKTKVQEL